MNILNVGKILSKPVVIRLGDTDITMRITKINGRVEHDLIDYEFLNYHHRDNQDALQKCSICRDYQDDDFKPLLLPELGFDKPAF